MLNIKGMLNNPLTHLGLGILSQSGPSQYPRGLSGVGTGALQGVQSYQAQQQNLMLNQVRQAQLEEARRKQEQEEALRAAYAEQFSAHPLSGILGADPDLARSMLMAQVSPQKPTSLMQNLEAAGLVPGTPEYEEALMAAITKPQVSIDQRPAPPAGYRYTAEGDLEAVIGGPATRFSESEAKQRAQAEVGMRLLDEVDTLVNAGAETGTAAWVRANAASTPLLSWTVNLTPEEAKIASNLEMLSNIMLAAQRGAQVGPEEQKRYDKQLPRLGQNDKLFAANLTATKRNLKELTEKIRKLRTGADGGKGGGGRKRYNPATGRLE